MAYRINGTGTTYLGRSDFSSDGSYVTTEWLTIFWVPVAPLQSMRVKQVGSQMGVRSYSSTYEVIEKVAPAVKQVLETYLFTVATALWLWGAYKLAWSSIFSDDLVRMAVMAVAVAAVGVVYWKILGWKIGKSLEQEHAQVLEFYTAVQQDPAYQEIERRVRYEHDVMERIGRAFFRVPTDYEDLRPLYAKVLAACEPSIADEGALSRLAKVLGVPEKRAERLLTFLRENPPGSAG